MFERVSSAAPDRFRLTENSEVPVVEGSLERVSFTGRLEVPEGAWQASPATYQSPYAEDWV